MGIYLTAKISGIFVPYQLFLPIINNHEIISGSQLDNLNSFFI